MVSCTFSFHHYSNPQKALLEISRVLTYRGKFILVDAAMSFPLLQLANILIRFSNEGDYKFYSKQQLAVLSYKAGLKVLNWIHIGGPGYLMLAEKV
jgi:ubiquinone/menaquinone biosynthesis C-methylase UbiE